MSHLQDELRWMRYPLWVWGLFSASVWLFLPEALIQKVTPWACGVTLFAAAGFLALLWYEIQTHDFAEYLKAELRRVAIAITVTGLAGIACWVLLPVQLSDEPSLALCGTAWALCSAGFVLSLLVTQLVLAFLLHIERRREENRTQPVNAKGSSD